MERCVSYADGACLESKWWLMYGHYYGMTDVNRAMNKSLYHYTRPKARFYLDTNDEGLLGHQSMA